MNEGDWKEEQRSVLARLFECAFKRREPSEDEIGADIHRLGTVRRRRLSKKAASAGPLLYQMPCPTLGCPPVSPGFPAPIDMPGRPQSAQGRRWLARNHYVGRTKRS
jgi:hypothetical protein